MDTPQKRAASCVRSTLCIATSGGNGPTVSAPRSGVSTDSNFVSKGNAVEACPPRKGGIIVASLTSNPTFADRIRDCGSSSLPLIDHLAAVMSRAYSSCGPVTCLVARRLRGLRPLMLALAIRFRRSFKLESDPWRRSCLSYIDFSVASFRPFLTNRLYTASMISPAFLLLNLFDVLWR